MKKTSINASLMSLGLLTSIIVGSFTNPANAFTRTKQLGSVRGSNGNAVFNFFTLVERDLEGERIYDTDQSLHIGYFKAAVVDYISISNPSYKNTPFSSLSTSESFFIPGLFEPKSTGGTQPFSDLITDFNNLNDLLGTPEFQSNNVSFNQLGPLDLKAEKISDNKIQYSFIDPDNPSSPILSLGFPFLQDAGQFSSDELNILTNKLPSIIDVILPSDKTFRFFENDNDPSGIVIVSEKSFVASTTTPEPGSMVGLIVFSIGGFGTMKTLKQQNKQNV